MKEYRTFYGGRSSNTLAYCHYHHLSLTPEQLKQKQCLKRQCGALQKFDHPYWKKREESKQKRKERKERLEAKYREVCVNAVCTEGASTVSVRISTQS